MSYANHMAVSARTDAGLASTLRIAVMRLARRLRSERSDDSLTLSQMATLGTIERHGPLTLSELAAHEKVQPPSMSRIVAALEQLGLVVRTPHPTDGRQVLIALTQQARDRIREDRRRRDAWLALRLRDLTPEERETLRDAAEVLEKLTRA
jgi:DNA-binding MarR family transcriptional regulator